MNLKTEVEKYLQGGGKITKLRPEKPSKDGLSAGADWEARISAGLGFRLGNWDARALKGV